MKYRYLIKNSEEVGLKHLKNAKTFIKYSNDVKDVNSSTEEYNSGKERKVLIVFDDMIADMISNKKLHPVVIELLIRKLNISLMFIT